VFVHKSRFQKKLIKVPGENASRFFPKRACTRLPNPLKNKLCVRAFVKIFVLVGLCAILLVFVLFQPIHSPLVIRMPCIPLGGGSDYTQVLYLLPPGTCIRFFISTLPKNELPNNELKWRQVIYFTDYGPDVRSNSAPRSLTAYIFPPGSSTPLGVLSGNFSLSILAESQRWKWTL